MSKKIFVTVRREEAEDAIDDVGNSASANYSIGRAINYAQQTGSPSVLVEAADQLGRIESLAEGWRERNAERVSGLLEDIIREALRPKDHHELFSFQTDGEDWPTDLRAALEEDRE